MCSQWEPVQSYNFPEVSVVCLLDVQFSGGILHVGVAASFAHGCVHGYVTYVISSKSPGPGPSCVLDYQKPTSIGYPLLNESRVTKAEQQT